MGFDADWHTPRVTIRRAEITKIDDAGEQQFADIRGLEGEEFKAVYRAQTFGISGNPPPGSDGIVLMLGGRPDQAMLIGSEHPSHRPKNLPVGCKAIYNAHGDIISLLQRKIRIVTQGFEVEAKSLKLKGPLTIEGDVTHQGNITTSGTHTDANGVHS